MEVKRRQEEEERKRREEEERRLQVGVGSVAAGVLQTAALCFVNPAAVCRWFAGWVCKTRLSTKVSNNQQTDSSSSLFLFSLSSHSRSEFRTLLQIQTHI